MTPFADAALGYANLGWPVFPLIPRGKIPLIGKDDGGKGCHDATTDTDQVWRWWKRWPTANIGLAAGPAFFALDVDGDDGLATLAELEDLHRWLPVTPASVTGSGGMHLFFAPTARVKNSVKRLGAGLDTRAAGGYVVGAPSIHPNGARYLWLHGRDPWTILQAEVPGWLLGLLDPPRPAYHPPPPMRGSKTGYAATALARELEAVALAGEKTRNNTLYSACCRLGRFIPTGELSAATIGPALVGAAMSAGLSRLEAEKTARSGLRQGAAP